MLGVTVRVKPGQLSVDPLSIVAGKITALPVASKYTVMF